MKRILAIVCLFASLSVPLTDAFAGEPVFRLYVTRHAQRGPRDEWPEADRAAVMPGELIDGIRVPAEGDSITPLGVRQATALGRHLRALGFHGDILVSPNFRTMQTASVIAEQLGEEAKLSTDVNLLNGTGRKDPAGEAFPTEELRRRFPARMTTGNRPEDLVSFDDFLAGVLAAHPTGECLLVGHSSSLPDLLRAIDHRMKDRSLRIARTVANCCLFAYDFDADGVCVDSDILNDDYLTPDLLTSNFSAGKTPPRRKAKRLAAIVRAGKPASAPFRLVAPADGATVPTLTNPQKAYLALPADVRIPKFADKDFRATEMGLPAETVDDTVRKAFWPKTLTLDWEAESNAVYRVRVAGRRGDVAFDGTVAGGTLAVDNLEIAEEYEWTVSSGAFSASGSFRTEDLAPRIVRFPGINNARDLGGRIGLDGRRVRQGLVFRCGELNRAASAVYFTREELEANGRLAELAAKRPALQARLDQLLAWQAKPGSMDREDAEYADWCKRHPDEPVATFLDSRIQTAQKELARIDDPKIEKCRKAGPLKFEDGGREYVRARFGIRSDIDLRNDQECGDMTSSPFGDDVHWFHCSSAMYGGIVGNGKDAFRNVFRVFLDEANYPIAFHCVAGQDRTGSVAYVLGALLGYDEETLSLDWETTGFWNRDRSFNHARLYDSLVKGFVKKYPAPTVRERAEAYVLDLGFTMDDIEKFRSIMLEAK